MSLIENKDAYISDTGAVSKLQPFRKSSGYQPLTTCNVLEQYIDKTKLELSSITNKTLRKKLTNSELNTLPSFKINFNIVLKKADIILSL